MVDFPVYQNQWLFIALFGGAALLLMFVVTYYALWRPRKEEQEAERTEIRDVRSFLAWLHRAVPWAIILAILGTTIYTIVHTGMAALKTPNW